MYGDKQQLVIPTPETKPVDVDTSLIDVTEGDFKMPKQYIHIQGQNLAGYTNRNHFSIFIHSN